MPAALLLLLAAVASVFPGSRRWTTRRRTDEINKQSTQNSHGRRRLVLRPQGEDTRGLPSGDVLCGVIFRGRSWSEIARMGDGANAGSGSETKISTRNGTLVGPGVGVGWLVGWSVPFDGHRGHYLRRSSFLVVDVPVGDCWHGWSGPLLVKQFDLRLDMSGKIRVTERVGETEGPSSGCTYIKAAIGYRHQAAYIWSWISSTNSGRSIALGVFFVTPSRCEGAGSKCSISSLFSWHELSSLLTLLLPITPSQTYRSGRHTAAGGQPRPRGSATRPSRTSASSASARPSFPSVPIRSGGRSPRTSTFPVRCGARMPRRTTHH